MPIRRRDVLVTMNRREMRRLMSGPEVRASMVKQAEDIADRAREIEPSGMTLFLYDDTRTRQGRRRTAVRAAAGTTGGSWDGSVEQLAAALNRGAVALFRAVAGSATKGSL